jgi:hypothetical protein
MTAAVTGEVRMERVVRTVAWELETPEPVPELPPHEHPCFGQRDEVPIDRRSIERARGERLAELAPCGSTHRGDGRARRGWPFLASFAGAPWTSKKHPPAKPRHSPWRSAGYRMQHVTATKLPYSERSALVALMEAHPFHGPSCACRHHHHQPASDAPRKGAVWSALLPVVACAVCPGCLASYAKILSTVGVGIALSETQHLGLLVVCIALSLGVGLREARTVPRWGPFVVNILGCGLLVAVHQMGEQTAPPWLSWSGIVLLLGGVVWGHRTRFAFRRSSPSHPRVLLSPSRRNADDVTILDPQRAS